MEVLEPGPRMEKNVPYQKSSYFKQYYFLCSRAPHQDSNVSKSPLPESDKSPKEKIDLWRSYVYFDPLHDFIPLMASSIKSYYFDYFPLLFSTSFQVKRKFSKSIIPLINSPNNTQTFHYTNLSMSPSPHMIREKHILFY